MSKLKKELGVFDIFAIAAGAMISSGLFVLPGIAFKHSGPAVIFSYVIAGLLYIPALMCQAELSTAMPKAGGTYFFVDRSMGPAAGSMGGMAHWLSLSLKSAFALIGIGATLTIFFSFITPAHIKLIAVAGCIFFMFLNAVGVKEAGRFQIYLVVGLLIILVYYIIQGFPHVEPPNFKPFFTGGIKGVIYTAGLVFISFAGVTSVTSVAEETKNPTVTIPKGMFMAFLAIMFLYVASVFITVGVVPADVLEKSLTPLVDGTRHTPGMFGVILVSVAAMLAFITTANAGVMSASRGPMAMSRDGHLPEFFQKVHKRFNTPVNSILFTGLSMILAIVFLELEDLVKTASCIQIIIFILSVLSVIVMRESRIANYKPSFKSFFYPYLHVAGIIGYVILLFSIGGTPLLLAAITLLAGLMWFFVSSTLETRKRESALVHVFDRVTSPGDDYRPKRKFLRRELRNIIRERDEITEDWFDRLVKESNVLDLHWILPLTGFVRKASKAIEKNTGLTSDELYEILIDRISESPRVVRPGLAIVEIIREEEIPFSLTIVRNVHGMEFSPILPPVYTVYILSGSKCDYHLFYRAVFALAEITQRKDFDKSWLGARNQGELKNLLLTQKRKRIYDVYCSYIQNLLEELEIAPEELTDKYKTLESKDFQVNEEFLYGLPLIKGIENCRIYLPVKKGKQMEQPGTPETGDAEK